MSPMCGCVAMCGPGEGAFIYESRFEYDILLSYYLVYNQEELYSQFLLSATVYNAYHSG